VSRPSRRTNLALLALFGLALLTGTLSYGIGTVPASAVVAVTHGAVGLAIVLLVPWKSVTVRRGLRRGDHPGRGAGVALAGLVALVVLAGLAQAVVGYEQVVGLSPLQVHVTAALLAVPLLVRHLVTHPQRPQAADLSRRTALKGLALGGGALATWLAVDRTTAVLGLPGADDRGTGSTELGTGRPAAMPVTQWFTDSVPSELPDSVRVAGVLRDVADLDAVGDVVVAVLDCTGGWFAEQRWRGARLDRLLPDPLPAGVRSLDVVSVTGYRRRFPVGDAPALLLATGLGDGPLSAGHGAGVRLVAPGRRGFWWVKWVERVELSDRPPWWQPPFPLQ
jgi:hypothetical protein